MGITIGKNQAQKMLELGIGRAREMLGNPDLIAQQMDRVEEYLKEYPGAGQKIPGIPQLISLVRAYGTEDQTHGTDSGSRISEETLLRLLGAFVYLEKKDDLIPDDLPAIGIADDLAVLSLAMEQSSADLEPGKETGNGVI